MRDREVEKEIEFIAGTIPGKVFWADDGTEALFVHEDGSYVISVEQGEINSEPIVSSAYTVALPPADIIKDSLADVLPEIATWAGRWEC